MIFHASVVEDVAANLASPLYLFLSGLDLCLLSHFLFQGPVVELTLQQLHGLLAVFGLVTRLGVLNEDLLVLARIGIFILVTQAHARLHLVDILSTGTT